MILKAISQKEIWRTYMSIHKNPLIKWPEYIRVCTNCEDTVIQRNRKKVYCTCHENGLPMVRPSEKTFKYLVGKEIIND